MIKVLIVKFNFNCNQCLFLSSLTTCFLLNDFRTYDLHGIDFINETISPLTATFSPSTKSWWLTPNVNNKLIEKLTHSEQSCCFSLNCNLNSLVFFKLESSCFLLATLLWTCCLIFLLPLVFSLLDPFVSIADMTVFR